ncbi:MAG TPA: hypothetical protein DCO83_11015 [Mucilaginibacter sp.]|nr:hypothetical protein [Mucilaginibacter sp.]
MEKTKTERILYCPKCGASFHFRLHRPWLLKKLSFLFPVRKYFCAKCKRSSYVFVKKDKD